MVDYFKRKKQIQELMGAKGVDAMLIAGLRTITTLPEIIGGRLECCSIEMPIQPSSSSTLR
jgi:hypothetical protein